MTRVHLASAIAWTAAVLLGPAPSAAQTLYGGVGRGSATNAGALVRIDPATGAGTVVGSPAGIPGLTGLGFTSSGALFASTLDAPQLGPGPRAPTLIRLDPVTGSLLAAPVPITVGGAALSVNDLAVQPGTDALFGTSVDVETFTNNVYRIDPTTGIATLVGNTGLIGATLAFGPGGALYMTSAMFTETGSFVQGFLHTLNPATAAVLTTSAPFTAAHVGGLAVRSSDGVIFASGGMGGDLYTLSPTGALTAVGVTGVGGVGDIAFQPSVVPEPGTVLLLGSGLAGLAIRTATRRRRERA